MLKRIKYVSRMAKAFSSESISALVEKAKANNSKHDITGVLMTSGGLFFQVIEGPVKEIDELYWAITRDERHKDVLLLSENLADERVFPDWSMRSFELDQKSEYQLEPLKVILETIIQHRDLIAKLSDTLERSIWHEFVNAK